MGGSSSAPGQRDANSAPAPDAVFDTSCHCVTKTRWGRGREKGVLMVGEGEHDVKNSVKNKQTEHKNERNTKKKWGRQGEHVVTSTPYA